ncbi:MAG: hypothetical protein KJ579_05680 [Verrucomicrobia bacterium]|nr:hypothetical protein [Verrucomicrobiota bacterium]
MMSRKQGQRTPKRGEFSSGIRGLNRRARFPGICEAAERLGVGRVHLYFVLTGARRSPRIERDSWARKFINQEAPQ